MTCRASHNLSRRRSHEKFNPSRPPGRGALNSLDRIDDYIDQVKTWKLMPMPAASSSTQRSGRAEGTAAALRDRIAADLGKIEMPDASPIAGAICALDGFAGDDYRQGAAPPGDRRYEPAR